jgi:hypothetical protein
MSVNDRNAASWAREKKKEDEKETKMKVYETEKGNVVAR